MAHLIWAEGRYRLTRFSLTPTAISGSVTRYQLTNVETDAHVVLTPAELLALRDRLNELTRL